MEFSSLEFYEAELVADPTVGFSPLERLAGRGRDSA